MHPCIFIICSTNLVFLSWGSMSIFASICVEIYLRVRSKHDLPNDKITNKKMDTRCWICLPRDITPVVGPKSYDFFSDHAVKIFHHFIDNDVSNQCPKESFDYDSL